MLDSFIDIVELVELRAKIAGKVQTRDRDFVKSAINEVYEKICSERRWHWLKKDRAFNFYRALKDGTINVVNRSRVVTFVGLIVDETFLGRSLKVDGQEEIYRIIGFKVSTNEVYLDSVFVGNTENGKTFKLYQYEFALPPNLDNLSMVHIDTGLGSRSGELDYWDVLRFNRELSSYATLTGVPIAYNMDGTTYAVTAPPLKDFILDYDFLGGGKKTQRSKLRIFPIEPDKDRLIHLNYSCKAPSLKADEDQPLIPVNDRWVLVHGALELWHLTQGSGASADRARGEKERILADMRQEYIKTDVKPQLIFDARRYRRSRNYRSSIDDLFIMSRDAENS